MKTQLGLNWTLPVIVAVSLLSAPTLWIGGAALSLVQDGKAVYTVVVPDGQSNGMLPPLVDLGPGQTYNGQEGGLYLGGSNVRPAAHDAAGRKIARGIVPLAADGNPDPVNGKIVIMPVSVSNGYGAWHLGDAGDTSTTFMTRANANPAKNPKLLIAYGFEYQLPGGNRGTGDPGPNSTFYRTLDHALHQQGVTPRQVQIVWLSMPVSGMSWGTNLPPEARTFPADAQQSKHAWKEIVHAIHIRYPNVKMIYSSTKGAMYMSALENPEFLGGPIEPWNHDAAWGVKWVIQDQINGAPDLNYDPARGPVTAPWLSWGPYFWSYPDGTPRHDDGFVWTLADVGPDHLHPSLSGLTKYANMLLHQMTTDPTATPWFLRPGAPPNKPPTIAKAARVAANPVSGATTALSVLGADDGGEPNLTYTWSCSGPAGVTFSVNGPNRAKNTTATFPSAGRYRFQVTIGDSGGLTATSSIGVTVSPAAAFDHATVNSNVANHPPTVATAASATPNPTTGMTTNLRVLGDDDGGEANLTYTWSWIGPAGVTFSANGMNAAKNTTATFLNPGRYTFHVAIQDAGGGFAASGTTVTVIGR